MRFFFTNIIFLTTIFSGCYPEPIKYKVGLGTRLIEGTLLEKGGDSLKSKSFIIVVEYYSQFIKFENESPIYVPKARLVFPDQKGNFRINFDLRATSIELSFVASGYSIQRFFFRRQIGVGNLKYDVGLIPNQFWENEFYLQTGPYIENFILEQRYKMPDSHQMFLGNWLADLRRDFAEKNN
tara:strand:+ start:181 stop:726 length:546 start_codon:yes stop_codon:yes gene_type:complete